MERKNVKLQINNYCAYFKELQIPGPDYSESAPKTEKVLESVNLDIYENEIFSIIGPARSGKTTLLRSINRLNDENLKFSYKGDILLDGKSIYQNDTDVSELRRTVGMVFARPVVLPMSIFENIAYGLRLKGINKRDELMARAEESLKASYLWEEVKNRLNSPAQAISGGQQQRLCIARVIALKPEIIMLDEPTSALDPISTTKIEDTLSELKEKYTIILVTNNTKQAARVGTRTAFFLMGRMIECADTEQMFTSPYFKETEDYITGRFG